MFGNIGWGEFVVLLVAALVVLGPERLPGAVSWVTRSLRQVRDYASGARDQLKEELGPEFDDFRQPLAELNQLRGMTPKAVITKHLLDGDSSVFDDLGSKPGAPSNGSSPSAPNLSKDLSKPLGRDEKPPIDPDAT